MPPQDVSDLRERAAYEKQLAENEARCERQRLQLLLPHLEADAETAFRRALRGLVAVDNGTGSHFAYALGKSNLSGKRSQQMWAIFEHRDDNDWPPTTSYSPGPLDSSFTEDAKPADLDKHIAEWLDSSDPREVAWAAYYAARDKRQRTVPALLAYVHRHAYDPVFETGADKRRNYWPEVKDAVDAMHAVLVALIKLHATVPAEDLLQIAPVVPNYALILAALPAPQERVLMQIYISGGFKPLARGEYFSRPGAQPKELDELMRWTAAGNIMANRNCVEFARTLFDNFVLRLDFTVVGPDTLFTGGGPVSIPSFMGRERGADWPPIGHYGLGTNMPKPIPDVPSAEQFKTPSGQFKYEPCGIESAVELANGSPSIYLESYVDRRYGFSLSYMPFRFNGPLNTPAHWLEKMGMGEYGTREGFDPWNPGSAFPLVPSDHKAFYFYRIFTVTSDEQYHSELRSWIADQREVWANIVRGMRAKNLITEGEAKRPLRMKVIGADSRRREAGRHNGAFPKKPAMQAYFPDVVPPGTEITWEDRYAK